LHKIYKKTIMIEVMVEITIREEIIMIVVVMIDKEEDTIEIMT